MGVFDDLSNLDYKSPTPMVSKKSRRWKKLATKRNIQLVNQSTAPSVNRSVDQSTNHSIDQLANIDTLGPVVARPRAFYITQKVDRWIDEAVRYLRDQGMYKMDRSVLVNTLIHNPEIYNKRSLDKLRNKLLMHMTNKSLKRVQSTS